MPTLANGMQAVLQFTQEGQIIQNVLQFIRFGGFDAALIEQTAEDLITWWDTNIQPQAADNLSLTMVKAKSLVTEDEPTIEVTTGLPLAGTGGLGLPNNCTVAFTLRTGLGGRSNRGRIFHCGLRRGELDASDPNLIDPAGLAALLADYRLLLDNATWSDPGVDLAVWSRLNNSGRVVTAIASDGVVDSQRRRLPGRGA